MGLDVPDSGSALIGGRPYAELAWPLREVGALLDAKAFHPARTARSHLRWLALTNDIPLRRVDEVLDQVGLTAVAGKRAGKFSLGMGQRLGIAAALLGEPGGAAVRRAGQRPRPRGHPVGPPLPAGPGRRGPDGARLEPPDQRDGAHRRPAGGDRPGPADRRDERGRLRRPQRRRRRPAWSPPTATPSPKPSPGPAPRSTTAATARCRSRASPPRRSATWPPGAACGSTS